MGSEIINALLLGEGAYPRTTVMKWTGNEEGSFIPRCRETPNRLESHESQETEALAMNMANCVLVYTRHKWL